MTEVGTSEGENLCVCAALNSLSGLAHPDAQETVFEVGDGNQGQKRTKKQPYSTGLNLDLVWSLKENQSRGTDKAKHQPSSRLLWVLHKKKEEEIQYICKAWTSLPLNIIRII